MIGTPNMTSDIKYNVLSVCSVGLLVHAPAGWAIIIMGFIAIMMIVASSIILVKARAKLKIKSDTKDEVDAKLAVIQTYLANQSILLQDNIHHKNDNNERR